MVILVEALGATYGTQYESNNTVLCCQDFITKSFNVVEKVTLKVAKVYDVTNYNTCMMTQCANVPLTSPPSSPVKKIFSEVTAD